MEGEDWVAEETAHPKNSRVGKLSGPRERTKRDFSTAQIETFAGAKAKEKASVCFGRNDKFRDVRSGINICRQGKILSIERARRVFFAPFLFGVGGERYAVEYFEHL
jgi:hypothetical protein